MEAKTYCIGCIHKEICGWYPQEGCDRFVSVDDVAEVPKWIPVTERLPSKECRYMVTRHDYVTNTETIDILWYEKNIWWNGHSTGDYAVTAWRELPEPWEGGADVY